MKKRLLVLVLSLFVGMFLVACTENTPEPEPNPEKELTKFHIFSMTM